ncbi:MAG: methylated-DNA--[protein]-cysteine S-methyltransferase [Nitrospirae bacterium]|nr:methylated-DNA--[protein]-cysteine S-methyltransferase [Nitrospirota bacterium]
MKLYYTAIDLPTGVAFAAATEKGLVRLTLRMPPLAEFLDEIEVQFGAPVVEDDKPFRLLRRELKDYFAGRPVAFTTPLDLRGTEFQMAVWRALLTVPYGEVRSYRWLADAVGRSHAARAVGGAVGRNRVGIIVPCHRIIESSGGLGGYGWGLDVKRRLLEIEGALQ